jgi:hypothetical protein
MDYLVWVLQCVVTSVKDRGFQISLDPDTLGPSKHSIKMSGEAQVSMIQDITGGH